MRLFAWLLLLAACGEVDASAVDASAVDASAIDAVASDARTDCGSTMAEPGRTCRTIKRACGINTSGSHWITAGGPAAFEVYCDMDDASDGGGWTLFAKNEMASAFTWVAWRGGTMNVSQLTTPIVMDQAFFRISQFDGLGNDVVALRQSTDVGRTSFWVLGRAATVSARINAVEVRFGDYSNVQYFSGSLETTSLPLAAANPNSSLYEHVLWGKTSANVSLSAFGSNAQAGVFGSATEGATGTWGHSATLWIREEP